MTSRMGTILRSAGIGITALALSATVFAGGPAAADPLSDAKAKVEALTTKAALIDQDYAGVQEKLTTGQQRLKSKEADVRSQADKVNRMRNQVGQVALAQFQNRNVDTTAQLFFTSDTDGFLSQMSTVQKVSENQNSVLQDFQTQQANLADLKRSAEAEVAELAANTKEKERLRRSSDAKVAEAKSVLADLTEQQRLRLAEQQRREAQQAAEQAAAATATAAANDRAARTSRDNNRSERSQSSDTRSNDTRSSQKPAKSEVKSASVPASGRAGAAMAFARAQIGKPYVYGGTGPGGYDCSGLTGAAWHSAGVSLPRTSQAQYGAGRHVSRSELQPGDLVFFYGLGHVGLYAGNGQVLHASHPGKPVGYEAMSNMPYVGAVRPG